MCQVTKEDFAFRHSYSKMNQTFRVRMPFWTLFSREAPRLNSTELHQAGDKHRLFQMQLHVGPCMQTCWTRTLLQQLATTHSLHIYIATCQHNGIS